MPVKSHLQLNEVFSCWFVYVREGRGAERGGVWGGKGESGAGGGVPGHHLRL